MGSIPVGGAKKEPAAFAAGSFLIPPRRTHSASGAKRNGVRIPRPKIDKRLAKQGICQAQGEGIFAAGEILAGGANFLKGSQSGYLFSLPCRDSAAATALRFFHRVILSAAEIRARRGSNGTQCHSGSRWKKFDSVCTPLRMTRQGFFVFCQNWSRMAGEHSSPLRFRITL